jgi:hypothetical protein
MKDNFLHILYKIYKYCSSTALTSSTPYCFIEVFTSLKHSSIHFETTYINELGYFTVSVGPVTTNVATHTNSLLYEY